MERRDGGRHIRGALVLFALNDFRRLNPSKSA
jgi:hypothetical protein